MYPIEAKKKLLDYVEIILDSYKPQCKKISNKGKIKDKNIYIKESLSLEDKHRTLVHEYIHILQKEVLFDNSDPEEIAEKIACILYPK